MKKPTWEEVKETMVKYNDGNDKFGTVFDAVCKTIAHYISDEPRKPKKKPKKKLDDQKENYD